jgi:hypothetical protein
MKVKKGLERRDHRPVFMKQKRMKYKVGRISFYRVTGVKTASTGTELANTNTAYSYKRQHSIFNPYNVTSNVTKLLFGFCHGKHNMTTYQYSFVHSCYLQRKRRMAEMQQAILAS